jgi:hypothetical protein
MLLQSGANRLGGRGMSVLVGSAVLVLVASLLHLFAGVGVALAMSVGLIYGIYSGVYLHLYKTNWRLQGDWRAKFTAVNRWGVLAGAGANGFPVWFVHLGIMGSALTGGFLSSQEFGLGFGKRLALGLLLAGIGYLGVGLGHLQHHMSAARKVKQP